MSEIVTELRNIYEDLESFVQSFDKPEIAKPLEALEKSATEIGKAWSHSWLGYQSHVYYEGLKPPPPGANFSSEWGLKEAYSLGSRGNWVQFPEDAVEIEIRKRARNPDTTNAHEAAENGRVLFEHKQGDVISILRTAKGIRDDLFLDKLLEETEEIKVPTTAEFIRFARPSGQLISRDAIAVTQGLWTPPHISILADIADMRVPKLSCEALAAIVRRSFR